MKKEVKVKKEYQCEKCGLRWEQVKKPKQLKCLICRGKVRVTK